MSSAQLLSRLPAEVGGVNGAQNIGRESGVSMQIDVKERSVRKDEADRLDTLKSEVLDNRPDGDSLSWPAQKKDEQK